MPVYNELTNATREQILRVLQRDSLYNPSTLEMVLCSMARRISGTAGHGLAITDAVDLPQGEHYAGFDPAENFEIADGPVRHYANWTLFAVPVAMAGQELHENLGMTTDELLGYSTRVQSMNAGDRLTMFSILGKRYEDAGETHGLTAASDLWGYDLGGNDPRREMRRPESLQTLFNPNGPLHGLEPDGLGEWNENLHPWGRTTAPGDGLTAAQRRLVHVPRIFNHGGTPQNLTKSVVESALLQMQGVGGEYIAAVHPTLVGEFFSEFDGNDQGPVLLGYDQWRLEIDSIKYLNCTFFLDDHAPLDKLYMIHIGSGMGVQAKRNPGFQIIEWAPRRTFRELDAITKRNMMKRREPRGVRFGYNDRKPYYQDDFGRLYGLQDAAGTRIRRMYAQVCFHRWKHIEIGDLRPN